MDVEIIFHIKEFREEKKITLREFSEKSEISKSEISFTENGQQDPILHTMCLLSLALGVPPVKLFTVNVKRRILGLVHNSGQNYISRGSSAAITFKQ